MSQAGTAVLGASGFIGNRLVEILHLAGMKVTPIVRRPSALALTGRFDLPARVADAFDTKALSAAFSGCDTAVVAVAGDPRTIVGSVDPVYRAAEAAGLRRLLYLSTASVHGQAPAPGTDETTPLSVSQPIAYNNAKVRAERRLRHVRRSGSVEIVLLRPGIVYGPRSYWTGGLADELLSGEAALVEGGHGICNGINVDNLVHAILLALAAPGVDGQAFLVGDRETVTWRDLYRPVADALGIDVDVLPTPPASAAAQGVPLAERVRDSAAFKLLPPTVRAGLAAAYRARGAGTTAPAAEPRAPEVTLEKALLHTCAYKLPWAKAEEWLGYRPVVSFADGCSRGVEWLEFAGYPIRGAR